MITWLSAYSFIKDKSRENMQKAIICSFGGGRVGHGVGVLPSGCDKL